MLAESGFEVCNTTLKINKKFGIAENFDVEHEIRKIFLRIVTGDFNYPNKPNISARISKLFSVRVLVVRYSRLKNM